jgi:SAM-dependent methyltransferase
MSHADDWNQRYAEGNTAWDLGGPPPVLVRVIAAHPLATARLRVLVPGAGRGNDAIAWAEAGHEVVAVDFANLAVAAAREQAAARGVSMEVLEADVFALPAALAGSFDLAWEQTCFCAIPVERRPDYARAMAEVLRPGGRLFALLWNHGREGGPPFDVRREDVEAVFPPRFVVERVEAVPDSAPRRVPELLAVMRRV